MIPGSVIMVKETFKSPLMDRMNKLTLLGSPVQAIFSDKYLLASQFDVCFNVNDHDFVSNLCQLLLAG